MSNLKCICGRTSENSRVTIESDCHGSCRVECTCGICAPWFDFRHLLGDDDYLTPAGEMIADKRAIELWEDLQRKLVFTETFKAVLTEHSDTVDEARKFAQGNKYGFQEANQFGRALVAIADALGASDE
jgi:hypothetical protein